MLMSVNAITRGGQWVIGYMEPTEAEEVQYKFKQYIKYMDGYLELHHYGRTQGLVLWSEIAAIVVGEANETQEKSFRESREK